ncbi:PREDICTED: G-type lectin S-receptor-like serine/threonine-protein kinase LECRK1, partial [Nelumbo nucifera]|uniref:G-type lectin S-receptor-like serine/threonine-protein kinase LECRK1 n=1 Tax=Nelumbo nucifera TaxID=4432 RepID=A0A1U7Z4R2_NELNU
MPITVKADVYSFGIVLLEMVCCRRSVDISLPEDEIVLTDRVYDCYMAGELNKLLGDEEVEKRGLERMVTVGLWCIQDEPSLRPSMKVVLMLEGTVEIPIPPDPSSFLNLDPPHSLKAAAFCLAPSPSLMASKLPVFFVFVFLSVLCLVVGAQQNLSNLINLGSSLSPSTQPNSWLSSSGRFEFGFYPEGKGFSVGIRLVGNPEKTVVWTARRDDPPVSSNATLALTKEGWLVLRTEKGEEINITGASDPASFASLLDSGNFVLYDNVSNVIWKSFDSPTDTILGGQNLTNGNLLVSSVSNTDHSSGRFILYMQSDGNLVAYPINTTAESLNAYDWTSTYTGGDSINLNLDYNGNLFLSQQGSLLLLLVNLSSSSSSGHGAVVYRATLDPNGNFLLYSHSFSSGGSATMKLEWSALQDQCEVKGFCGFNSYCALMGSEHDCLCFPGFNFIDPNQKFLGCQGDFGPEGCRDWKEAVKQYTVIQMKDLVFPVPPYSVVPMTEADCSKSCLEDCNCGAALFDSNGN